MAKKENNKKNYQAREKWLKEKRKGRRFQQWTVMVGWIHGKVRLSPEQLEAIDGMEAR